MEAKRRTPRTGRVSILSLLALLLVLALPSAASAAGETIEPQIASDAAVVATEGTPKALSSMYAGPDLCGRENIGSAMSAEIDLVEGPGGGIVDPVVEPDDASVTVPEGTPTTISCTSTVPDPEMPASTEATVCEESTVPVTSTSAAAGTASIAVPRAVHAGAGGTAGTGPERWLLLGFAGVLAMGLTASAFITRGTSRT